MENLLFIICSNTKGGHEIQSIEFVNSLSKYFNITVIYSKYIASKIDFKKNINLISVEFNLSAKGNILKQILYSQKLRKRKNLINHMIENKKIIISAGAVEAGISCLLTLQNIKNKNQELGFYLPFFYDRNVKWPKPISTIYNKILSFILNQYKYIITINKLNQSILSKRTTKPVYFVSNSISDKELQTKGYISNARLIFIGRLGVQKRITQLIEWLDKKNNPFKEFVIIGDGPQMNKVRILSNKCRHIKLSIKGWLSSDDQLNNIYKNDILILNSLIEGEPMVLKESLSRGIRCISRRIESIKEIIPKEYQFSSENELITLLNKLSRNSIDEYFKKINISKQDRELELKRLSELIN